MKVAAFGTRTQVAAADQCHHHPSYIASFRPSASVEQSSPTRAPHMNDASSSFSVVAAASGALYFFSPGYSVVSPQSRRSDAHNRIVRNSVAVERPSSSFYHVLLSCCRRSHRIWYRFFCFLLPCPSCVSCDTLVRVFSLTYSDQCHCFFSRPSSACV